MHHVVALYLTALVANCPAQRPPVRERIASDAGRMAGFFRDLLVLRPEQVEAGMRPVQTWIGIMEAEDPDEAEAWFEQWCVVAQNIPSAAPAARVAAMLTPGAMERMVEARIRGGGVSKQVGKAIKNRLVVLAHERSKRNRAEGGAAESRVRGGGR